MENINASDEQDNVIKILENGFNCFVDAVPGSGKSTLSYIIANKFSNKNILSLTYSKNLKLEAQGKIKKYKISNLEIHSYHSFAIKYYNDHFDDSVIERIILNKNKLYKKDKIDLLILDEIQDMTPNIYNLIIKFLNDSNYSMQLLVMGDRDQAIFSFVDADSRFLTCADKIFPNKFNKAFLSRSYRLTNQVSQFVNKCMLGESKIITDKPGKKVKYIITNPYFSDFKKYIYRIIRKKINEGYNYDDIFILAQSVKGDKTPIKKLNQFLSTQKLNDKIIPIYINTTDEESLTNKMLKNKIVMTTYHQSKGRERKLVILLGFDESYYKYTGIQFDEEDSTCETPLYVAPTRPIEELIVVHGFQQGTKNENRKLPFLKMSIEELDNSDFCDIKIIGEELSRIGKKNLFKKLEWENYIIEREETHSFSVTELTTYLSESFISELSEWLNTLFTITNELKQVLKMVIYMKMYQI